MTLEHKYAPFGFPNVFDKKYWTEIDFQTSVFNGQRYFSDVEKWFKEHTRLMIVP